MLIFKKDLQIWQIKLVIEKETISSRGNAVLLVQIIIYFSAPPKIDFVNVFKI